MKRQKLLKKRVLALVLSAAMIFTQADTYAVLAAPAGNQETVEYDESQPVLTEEPEAEEPVTGETEGSLTDGQAPLEGSDSSENTDSENNAVESPDDAEQTGEEETAEKPEDAGEEESPTESSAEESAEDETEDNTAEVNEDESEESGTGYGDGSSGENGTGENAEIIDSGKINDISWSIDGEGLLTIQGTGDYINPGDENTFGYLPPWAGRDDVKSAKVDVSGITSTYRMFKDCAKIVSIDLSKLKTDNVNNMNYMFYGCRCMESLDLTGLNTGNVVSMSHMFHGCSSLSSLDVSSFNTSEVNDMKYMFCGCSNLSSLDVSSFNTSEVKDMQYMFDGCSSLSSLDVSGFDTSNVVNTTYMFDGCSSLSNLDISSFDTGNVKYIYYMFRSCSSLSNLDVSGFDTGNVTDMDGMFSGCSGITELDVSGFDTSKVTYMSDMFYGCRSLSSLDVSSFDTSKVTNMRNMFYGCSSLSILDLSSFDIGKLYSSENMLQGCYGLSCIGTPRNCNESIILPISVRLNGSDSSDKWYDEGGNEYAKLPSNLDYSIALYKNGYPGDGTSTMKRVVFIERMTVEDKVYDKTPISYTGTPVARDSSGNIITDVTLTSVYTGILADGNMYTETQDAPSQAGRYTLTVAMAENDKYIAGNAVCSFVITPKEIVIKAPSCTINSDEDIPELSSLTAEVDGLIGEDVLKVQPQFKYSADNIPNYLAGTYDIIPYGADAGNNYSIKYESGVLTVTGTGNSGKINDISWSIDGEGLLTIQGSGDYTTSDNLDYLPPWAGREDVKSAKVELSGITSARHMFDGCKKLEKVDLSHFNTGSIKDMAYMFYKCSALSSLDVSGFETSNVGDMAYMFYNCSGLSSLDVSGFDTGNVKYMAVMFSGCSGLGELDVSGFKTSNVENMAYMFRTCSGLSSLDVSGFDTSKVWDMKYMFSGCSGLSSLDVSGFDTSKVWDMKYMFSGCSGLSSLDVSSFTTSEVYDMSHMFSVCSNLSSLDVSSFTTSEVYDMSHMFSGCSSLSSLDASSFTTSEVENMKYMFNGCSSLSSLDVSSFDTSKVTNMSNMFYGCSSLRGLDLSSFDAIKVVDGSNMLWECYELLYIRTPKNFAMKVNLPKDEDAIEMYNQWYNKTGSKYKTLPQNLDYSISLYKDGYPGADVDDESGIIRKSVSGDLTWTLDINGKLVISGTGDYIRNAKPFWDIDYQTFVPAWCSYRIEDKIFSAEVNVSGITTMEYMFYQCYHLERIDFTNSDTSKVQSMEYMFGSCQKLKSINLANFDTANVTNMKGMFYDCRVLEEVDVSSFDTGNVTDMNAMFSECYALSNVDVSRFNTGKVKNMKEIFYECENLPSLDVSRFNTSNVTNMKSMFEGCKTLERLDLENFNTSNVTNMHGMFALCETLERLDLSGFDTSKVLNMEHMFDGCSGLNSLDISNFNTRKVETIRYMFSGCSNLASLDVSGFDISNIERLDNMFEDCSSLTSLDVSSFDTSKVTQMSEMFKGCDKLVNLDVSTFNTNKVIGMDGMFMDCKKLVSLDLSNFNTSNAGSMENMFNGCSSLTELDLSSFNKNEVWNMQNMFDGCSSLTSLDISNIDTSLLEYMDEMFAGCSNLVSLDLSNFDMSSVAVEDRDYFCIYGDTFFKGCDNLSYIRTPKNCPVDIVLPTGPSGTDQWYQDINIPCANLPLRQSESFELYRNGYPGDGITKNVAVVSGISMNSLVYNGNAAQYIGTPTVKDLKGNKITDVTFTYTYSGTLADGSVYAETQDAPSQTGDYKLFIKAESKDCSGRAVCSFSIEPRTVLVSAKSVSIEVGEDLPKPADLSYTVTGFIGDDTFTTEPVLKYSESDIQTDTVCRYGIIPSGAAAGYNYRIEYKEGTLTVGDPDDDSSFDMDERAYLNTDLGSLSCTIAPIKAKVYTGTAYEPVPRVTVIEAGTNGKAGKKKVLVEGTDYRVLYENNVDAGTGTVTVRGSGIYKGFAKAEFKITPKPVKKLKVVTGSVTGSISEAGVNSGEISLPVCVYDAGKLLKKGQDYTIAYDTVKKGTLTVKIKAVDGSNYMGETKAKMTVYEGVSEDHVINPGNVALKSYTEQYTGKAIKPAVEVRINGTVIPSKNYKVQYQNNKNAGTAYAIVTGRGAYKGKVVKEFEITANTQNFKITNKIKAQTYKGKYIKPSVTVKAGNKKLKKNTDYIVTYKNNFHAGTATITVTGKGNYTGSAVKTFVINPLKAAKISVKGTWKDSNGDGVRDGGALTVTQGKRRLKEGRDYMLEPDNSSIKKNKIKVTLKGAENSDFTGSVVKTLKME